jgi:hypothetical protein
LSFDVSGGLSLVGQAGGKLRRGRQGKQIFWQAKKFPHLATPDLSEKTDLQFKPERNRFFRVG